MPCFSDQVPGASIHNPRLPTHFMWLQQVDRRVGLYHENMLIAVTTDALRVIEVGRDLLEPALYFPPSDVSAELRPNGRRSQCPLKGEALHLDLVDPTGRIIVTNAAWTYPEPFEFASRLEGRLAFKSAEFSVEETPL